MDAQTSQSGQSVHQGTLPSAVEPKTIPLKRRLCQLRDGLMLEQPSSEGQFIKMILDHGYHCTCRDHNRFAYESDQCSKKHGRLNETELNDLWLPPEQLTQGTKYEALHLAHYTARYITTPEHEMCWKQKDALQKLRQESFTDFDVENVKDIPVENMQRLLDLISDLFFFGSLDVTFEWRDLSGRLSDPRFFVAGATRGADADVLICMNPRDFEPDSDSPRAKQDTRLKTLVHEAVHAFFKQYVCFGCRSWDYNVGNAGGHGRAFMEVATAIKRAFAGFGRPKQPVAEFSDWINSWEQVKYLPSIHDIQKWGWWEPLQKPSTTAVPPK